MDKLRHLFGIVLLFWVGLSGFVRLSNKKRVRVGTPTYFKLLYQDGLCQVRGHIKGSQGAVEVGNMGGLNCR
jgi:hypothetical protein